MMRQFPRAHMKKFLQFLWKGWLRFAHVVGRVNTVILLTVFYFVVLLPFGLVLRFLRVVRRLAPVTFWIAREPDEASLASLRRPF